MGIYDDLTRFKPDGLSLNGWAVEAGVSRTVWSDIRRHNNPSRRTLEKLLATAGSSLAEFEALRIDDTSAVQRHDRTGEIAEHGGAWRGAGLSAIPVFWSAVSSSPWSGTPVHGLKIDRSRVIASVARPASLANDSTVFAFAMPDARMWPRFREGRPIILSTAAQVEPGDDVLLTRQSVEHGLPDLAMIGELVERSSARIDLRLFKPDMIVGLATIADDSIARVMGEAF